MKSASPGAWYSSTSPVLAATSKWFTPATLTMSTAPLLTCTGERREPIGMVGKDLSIELTLHNQDGLAHVLHDTCGVEREIALEPRSVCGLSQLRCNAFPSRAFQGRGVDLLLQRDLRLLIRIRGLEPFEHMPLLLEDLLAPRRRRAGDECHRGNAFVTRGGQHRDPRPLAVANQADASLVDILALFFEPGDDGAHILRVVADRRRFGAAPLCPTPRLS